MNRLQTVARVFTLVVVLTGSTAATTARSAPAQSTAFTYQGQLKRTGSPTNGQCDFHFGLFDTDSGGTALDEDQASNVSVANGLFTVTLGFDATAFRISAISYYGADRWLEIGVRCPAGSGAFSTLRPRQQLTATPYALFAPLAVRSPDGTVRAEIDVLTDNTGIVRARGENGKSVVVLSTLSQNLNNGSVGVYEDGSLRGFLYAGSGGAGVVQTFGPNGNENTYLGFLNANPNHGYIGVSNADGDTLAGMLVNQEGKGELFAEVKDFAVDHPNRPDAKIVYASLEGPEIAIYHRGVVKLVKGRASVELPEHFSALANPETITVQLTPGSFDSEGLGFGAIRDGRIEVRELHHGTGSYDVHFVVHALRRGYEDRQPVVGKEEFRARYGPMVAGQRPALPAAGGAPLVQSARRTVK